MQLVTTSIICLNDINDYDLNVVHKSFVFGVLSFLEYYQFPSSTKTTTIPIPDMVRFCLLDEMNGPTSYGLPREFLETSLGARMFVILAE